MTNAQKIYAAVCAVPVGKVATYKMISEISGVNNPRVIGTYLHKNPKPGIIPCHRVVNVAGRLAPAFAFGGLDAQRSLLEKEGVVMKDKRHVNLLVSLWNPVR